MNTLQSDFRHTPAAGTRSPFWRPGVCLLLFVLSFATMVSLTGCSSSDASQSAAERTEGAGDTQLASVGMSRTDALLAALTVFVLAVFLGFELITKVPPTLHTPLMSGSNAISGITVVGAVLMAGCREGRWAAFLGMIAVAMAMVNVVGGFLVTDRMLSMFKKKK